VVETELCAAVADVLQRLGFQDFVIRINDRRILSGLLEATGIPADLHGQALVALDKMDKIGADGVRRELQERGISADGDRVLAAFAVQAGTPDVRRVLEGRADALAAVDAIDEIFTLSSATSAGPHLRFDVSLARGLSYYTGAIMEITVPDLAGSLGGGGRYDGLIGMFLGEHIPACGFSLGLERILVVMAERGMFPSDVDGGAADVLVTLFEGEDPGEALRLAGELRAAGLRVEVYPEPDKLGKQFKYAAAAGIGRVAVLGADERARGVVTIKDMTSGTQHAFARGDVPAQLSAGTAGRALAGVATPSEQDQ
jgi:histidyl-tRNA synthetase